MDRAGEAVRNPCRCGARNCPTYTAAEDARRRGKPRLLDLFCCEGGAAVGYHRAGFDVVGVDSDPRFAKRYPFEFHTADAIEFVNAHGQEFDAIHASPPCQHASAGTRAQSRARYPRLIDPTRTALVCQAWPRLIPWVIENVAGSDLMSPLVLCGTELGLTATDDDGTPLEMWRHRHFESNVLLAGNGGCQHGRYAAQVAGSYGGARRDKDEARHVRHGGYVPSAAVQRKLLGVDWMTQHGMHQCVPPAYTAHIGAQLLAHIEEARRAA